MKNVINIFLVLALIQILPFKIESQGIELEPPIKATSILDIFDKLSNFIFTLILYSLPILIVIGGLFYITSGGNPSQIEKGKKIVISAIIGLIIALFAKGLISLLKQAIKLKK